MKVKGLLYRIDTALGVSYCFANDSSSQIAIAGITADGQIIAYSGIGSNLKKWADDRGFKFSFAVVEIDSSKEMWI